MRYSDGNESKPGDHVQIDGEYSGLVVACIDSGEYLPGYGSWGYLKQGVMIETDFAGLVHYPPDQEEKIVLLHRGNSP
jgi:hypothetical protein